MFFYIVTFFVIIDCIKPTNFLSRYFRNKYVLIDRFLIKFKMNIGWMMIIKKRLV